MRIDVHIDRLVLTGTGLAPRQAAAVREALTTELTRLMRTAPPTSWQQARRRRLAAPPLPAGGDPAAVGAHIARSVFHGATGGGRR
jgi:hypothetical protein